MAAYRTIVVGTDGSESSYRAVDTAATLAAASGAHLVLACAHVPAAERDLGAAIDVLKDEAYQVIGSAPAEDVLRTAGERAKAAGAVAVDRALVVGQPVQSLTGLAQDVAADLIVVGNRGLNTVTGRLLGSVPSDVARMADCDVLIVDTVGSGRRKPLRHWWNRKPAKSFD
jgi:nucleotide-binding universal stress UspA family protein